MITITRAMQPNPMQNIEDLPVLLFEGEENAHRFVIEPAEGISFSGYEVTARFVRPDHTNVAVSGSLIGGNANVVLTGGCYQSSGKYKLFIFVTSENETACIYACTGPVVSTVGANGQAAAAAQIIQAYNPPQNIVDGPAAGSVIQGDLNGDFLNNPERANKATAVYSHAEGSGTTASGEFSHAEGYLSTSSGPGSHAEGEGAVASGAHSHAEGSGESSGQGSHAEGFGAVAAGFYSHAEGYRTMAYRSTQHVFGRFNQYDSYGEGYNYYGKYVEIVGNGTAEQARSNARTLDWDGNECLKGSLKLGLSTADETELTPAALKNIIALAAGIAKARQTENEPYDLTLNDCQDLSLIYTIEGEGVYGGSLNIDHIWALNYLVSLLNACRLNGLTVYQMMDRLINMLENWNGGAFGDNSGNYGSSHGVAEPAVVSLTPTFNTHPSNRTVNAGALTIMEANVSNVNSYQWQYSDDNGTTWTDCNKNTFTGAKTTRILFTATAAMNGYLFRVAATNEYGTAYSNAATLTVNS